MTPSQLNRLARDLLEGSFAQIWIEAEVSGFTRAASGHWYFTLKDSRAQLRCAMFRTANRAVADQPQNGDQVQARGKISLFEARGDFQFIIDRLQPAGLGAILRAFEALKARLAAEGLFAAERKRPLPRIPNRIAVVSSAKGAAIHDVLAILSRRWPLLEVDLYATAVQGTDASAEIRQALAAIAARGSRYDLVLLTRGGGAREDLLPFDDELLARAIASQPQPVISAVGHEIDFTIADLAADLRAPTPSAAAELIVPDASALAMTLEQRRRRLQRDLEICLSQLSQRHDQAGARLHSRSPQRDLAQLRQRLSNQLQRTRQIGHAQLEHRLRLLERLRARLQGHWPAHRLELNRSRMTRLSQRWSQLAARWSRTYRSETDTRWQRLSRVPIRIRIEALNRELRVHRNRLPGLLVRVQTQRAQRLADLARSLEGLGPNSVLARGYALLIDPGSGALIRSVSQLPPEQPVEARLIDGSRRLVACRRDQA